MTIGNKDEVFAGKADKTKGGLKKEDLILNKNGKVVSLKQSLLAKERIKKMIENQTGIFKLCKKCDDKPVEAPKVIAKVEAPKVIAKVEAPKVIAKVEALKLGEWKPIQLMEVFGRTLKDVPNGYQKASDMLRQLDYTNYQMWEHYGGEKMSVDVL